MRGDPMVGILTSKMLSMALMMLTGAVLVRLGLLESADSRILSALAFLKFSGIARIVPGGKEVLLVTFLAVTTPSANTVTQFAQVYGQDADYAGSAGKRIPAPSRASVSTRLTRRLCSSRP